MKKIIPFLLMTFLINNTALAQPKIWETEDQIINNVGQVQIRMNKQYSHTAEVGAFQADTFDRDTDVMSVFRGVCGKLITIEVTARDARKLDLKRFLETRSGNDLPIETTLKVMQDALSKQCENLEVIRFTFRPAHHTKEDYSYEGTLTKANGWNIQDGRVETSVDNELIFELAYRDFFSVGGIHYKGRCEEKPVLMLEPQFTNNQERALAKPVEFYTWAGIAKEVSTLYGDKCPNTQEIHFIINPLSQNYKCKIENQDCFFISQKNKDWIVDTSQMMEKDYVPPIKSFTDILEVLAAGKFEIIPDYNSFFAFYFESFIGIYSDNCSAHIKDPVSKDIFTIERTFDDNGFLINETVDGPPRRINIERKYLDSFERLFNSWKMWAVGQLMNRMLKSHHRETNPMLSTQLSLGFFTGNYSDLEKIVQGNCIKPRIQTAYENMYNYTNNQKAIVGQFTTEKEKLIKDKDNGPSAPQAAKIIQDKRQEKINDQNQRAQKKHTDRIEDFKHRKAEGIAVHSGSKSKQPNINQEELLKRHQSNQKKITEMSQNYYKDFAEKTKLFQEQIRNASTPQERQRLQQEFQQEQKESLKTMQKIILDAKNNAMK